MARPTSRSRGSSAGNRSRKFATVGIALGVVALGGLCLGLLSHFKHRTVDRTTIRGAFSAYQAVADRGDWALLYPLMVKDLQTKIATTHENVRRTTELIERSYPTTLRRQALADLGPDAVRQAGTPAQYFAALVGASGRVALSIEEKIGSRMKRVEEDKKVPGRFKVQTVSGNQLEFMRGGDGLLYFVPGPTDVQQIHHEYLRSIDNLDATVQAVKTFGGAAAAR